MAAMAGSMGADRTRYGRKPAGPGGFGQVDLRDKGIAEGRAVVVIGAPGIGKSALLGAAEQAARAAGFQVLTTTGVECEAQLPFAGLHQLLRASFNQRKERPPFHWRS